jgi:flagellar hook-basal body complex protein FliE
MATDAINMVLAQIRANSRTLESTPAPAASQGLDFQALLLSSMNDVAAAQQEATELKAAFEQGINDIELPEVMIASQKATIAFEATVEVRNKLLAAYQEIMNMQV